MTRLGVRFTEPDVTCVSRPPNQGEDWAIRCFERHAWKCGSCKLPTILNKSDIGNCLRGSYLAENVLKQLRYAGGGHAISTTEQRRWHVRVEVPIHYEMTWDLLYADRHYRRSHRSSPTARSNQRGARVHKSNVGATYFSFPNMPLDFEVDTTRAQWSNEICEIYSILRRVFRYVW
ncbi:hypothetical protein BDV97DRAFT_174984 [Delphinella strobiligena]|nr:hypothetical protein BDV97DRAFT_174984 [Delphinella strobiligena]